MWLTRACVLCAQDRYNLSPAAIGLVLTAVSASYAVLAPLVGSITRCLTPAKTMFIGMLLSGASFVFVGPIPFIEDLVDKDSSLHLAVLVLSFLVTGVGNALAFIPALPKMLESVQHLGGRVTGAVSGSFYALFSIGQTFGPFIGTLLVKFVGFQWYAPCLLCVALSVSCLVALSCLFAFAVGCGCVAVIVMCLPCVRARPAVCFSRLTLCVCVCAGPVRFLVLACVRSRRCY